MQCYTCTYIAYIHAGTSVWLILILPGDNQKACTWLATEYTLIEGSAIYYIAVKLSYITLTEQSYQKISETAVSCT